jgi:hypothetical protein
MFAKLEANIRKYAGEEWLSSLRKMWRCIIHGTFFSSLRIVNKMKQILEMLDATQTSNFVVKRLNSFL